MTTVECVALPFAYLALPELEGHRILYGECSDKPMVAKSEREAMIDIHMDQPSMRMFVNPNVHGPLGYPTGYEIMPGTTAWSLLDADDGVQKVGAFFNHQLCVTPYRADELYVAAVYPIQSKGDDGLAVWTEANRPIENTDIVA